MPGRSWSTPAGTRTAYPRSCCSPVIPTSLLKPSASGPTGTSRNRSTSSASARRSRALSTARRAPRSVAVLRLVRPHEARERLAGDASRAVPAMTFELARPAIRPTALFVHVERARRIGGALLSVLRAGAEPPDEGPPPPSNHPPAPHVG